jgi:hypothetical protein
MRLRVRSPLDAQIIFHAVSLGILPMVSRRLDTEERRDIHSGCVFVWEERGANAEATGVRSSCRLGREQLELTRFAQLGIERWTDGIRWGPSRVRDVSNAADDYVYIPTEVHRRSSYSIMKRTKSLQIWIPTQIRIPRMYLDFVTSHTISLSNNTVDMGHIGHWNMALTGPA